jgi:hypothetical protein
MTLRAQCLQAIGERGGRGRKPPVLIMQDHAAPHKILGLGIGEEDPATPAQQKDGKTGGRDERVRRGA